MADLNTFLTRFLYSRLPQFSNTGSVSGVLTASTTTAGTIADTNETDLWTYSLPANTLDVNGRAVRITVYGTTAANADVKTEKLYFGSTVLLSRAAADNNGTFAFTAIVYRTGAATQLGQAQYLSNLGIISLSSTTPAETLSGAITIKMTGQNGTAAANDIVFKSAIVELIN